MLAVSTLAACRGLAVRAAVCSVQPAAVAGWLWRLQRAHAVMPPLLAKMRRAGRIALLHQPSPGAAAGNFT